MVSAVVGVQFPKRLWRAEQEGSRPCSFCGEHRGGRVGAQWAVCLLRHLHLRPPVLSPGSSACGQLPADVCGEAKVLLYIHTRTHVHMHTQRTLGAQGQHWGELRLQAGLACALRSRAARLVALGVLEP